LISPPKNLTPTRGNKQNAFQKRGYYVEFKWGRLHGSIVPKWVKRKGLKFTDSNEALKVVMKKLKEKQGQGYLVG
jgi:hypothetical protein